MTTKTAPTTIEPFTLGEPRSFRGLTIIPLFAIADPRLEYIGLDEALPRGLRVCEVDVHGDVETLLVENPLDERVLLYEGEELVGAKQNRILKRSVLVEPRRTIKVSVACVERRRWSSQPGAFVAAPRAAYPELRQANRAGQQAVWANVAAKSMRLEAFSPTEAAEAIYTSNRSTVEEYVQALPRLDGQSGAIVAVAGNIVCLDYVSRSDVFAGLYLKLLRGYALDAIERPLAKPLAKAAVARLLKSAERLPLVVDDEVVALTAYPA